MGDSLIRSLYYQFTHSPYIRNKLLYFLTSVLTSFSFVYSRTDNEMGKGNDATTTAGRKRKYCHPAADEPTAKKVTDEPTAKKDTDKPQAKKAADSAKKTVVSAPKPAQFTDLMVDCLEHVFQYLDFDDLVNIVDVNKNTTEAAELVFKRRYLQFSMGISDQLSSRPIQVDEAAKRIIITSASIGLKVLRYFGHLVTKFDMRYIGRNWTEVVRLMNEQCSAQLTEISLTHCNNETFSSIEKQFTTVEVLRITCSPLGKCVKLNEWFPSLKRLELIHSSRCVQVECIFPLKNYFIVDVEDSCLNTAEFEEMITSVPELETLALSGGVDAHTLKFISENLRDLKNLFLWDFCLETEPEEPIIFEGVEVLSIETGLLGFLPDEIPFEFDKLTELRLFSDELDCEWLNFAMRHKELTKLQLYSFLKPEVNDDQLAELAESLQQLTELDVNADVSADGLMHFLSKCKSLKMIRVSVEDECLETLRKTASAQWTTTVVDRQITFERKEE